MVNAHLCAEEVPAILKEAILGLLLKKKKNNNLVTGAYDNYFLGKMFKKAGGGSSLAPGAPRARWADIFIPSGPQEYFVREPMGRTLSCHAGMGRPKFDPAPPTSHAAFQKPGM